MEAQEYGNLLKASQLIGGEAGIERQVSLNPNVCLCNSGIQDMEGGNSSCSISPLDFVSLNCEVLHLSPSKASVKIPRTSSVRCEVIRHLKISVV